MVQAKVLIVVTSHGELGDTREKTGFWLSEMTHPYLTLVDAGCSVDIASIDGGQAPIDPRSREDEDEYNTRFLSDPDRASEIENTTELDAVDPAEYRAVLFSGGHGTMWDFPESVAVRQVATAIYDRGGVVAAVCHGPAALVNVKRRDGSYLIDGKQVTGFTNEEEGELELTDVVPFLLEDKLAERGARFIGKSAWSEHVVIDQRVVTGQNPQSAKALGRAVVDLLT